MRDPICSVPKCDRPRVMKQTTTMCTMHRMRWQRHRSHDLPEKKKLPDGIVKICKKHGNLTEDQIIRRTPNKAWISCKECITQCCQRFLEKNPSFDSNKCKKNYYVGRNRLKVPKAIYDHMLDAQNELCAICGGYEKIQSGTGRVKRLAIDHCHKTMEIRGLLCQTCNTSIGAMDHSIEKLKSAIAYLEKHANT